MNHYQVMGLRPGADLDQVKAAFRELAKLYHPDTTKIDKTTAEIRFKELNLSYHELLKVAPKAKPSKPKSTIPGQVIYPSYDKQLGIAVATIYISPEEALKGTSRGIKHDTNSFDRVDFILPIKAGTKDNTFIKVKNRGKFMCFIVAIENPNS